MQAQKATATPTNIAQTFVFISCVHCTQKPEARFTIQLLQYNTYIVSELVVGYSFVHLLQA